MKNCIKLLISIMIFVNTVNAQVPTKKGWNLISIPKSVSDGRKTILFPTAVSPAYAYQDGYRTKDTLVNGVGYWLKFLENGNIPFDGEEIFTNTCTVKQGWNIIGSLSTPVVVSAINSLPPGIIASGFFRYSNGYTFADTIYPGDGCWVKVNQSGVIVLSSITPTVTYGNKIYHTVKIGHQWWLKENLDIGTMIQGTDTSRNNGVIEKYCYNNDTVNCNTYGGFYQWNEAMQYAYGSSAATSKSSGGIYQTMQYAPAGSTIKGICPPGWHIPSIAEFETLLTSVGGSGNALKAIGQGVEAGAGTNTSGFSGLLAGNRDSIGGFRDLGVYWNLWGSDTGAWPTLQSISSNLGTGCCYSQSVSNMEDDGIIAPAAPPYAGYSARCVKDEGPPAPTLSSPANNSNGISVTPTLMWNTSAGATSYRLQVSTDSLFSSSVYNQSGLTTTSQPITGLSNFTKYYWHVDATNSEGTSVWSDRWSFTTVTACAGTSAVLYEGKTYHTVSISAQCWLKENLDVGIMINGSQNQTNNSTIEKYCYNNDTVNCNTYGGFYQWNEAMQYITTPGTQGICPTGWHLPTYSEFQTLAATVSNSGNALKEVGQGTGAGAGTNTSGFSALLTGYRTTTSTFSYLSEYTMFWSSTEYNTNGAYPLRLDYYSSTIWFANYLKTFGFSVRCVKD
jgi:uncharacterized protein (TIGR02145 family)